jgi:hypothetical protein
VYEGTSNSTAIVRARNFSQSCCVQQHAALKYLKYFCDFGVGIIFGGWRGGVSFGMQVLRIENKPQYMKVTSFVLSIGT